MPLTSSEEAVPTDTQITKPCHDCPWRRQAIEGWLGGLSAEEWLQIAHSDANVPCHALKGPQCAGLAVFRANMCKLPRDPEVLQLPADRESVFSHNAEFLEHHRSPGGKRGT